MIAQRGFTLIEILVVISIIVVLSSIGVVRFMEMRENAELRTTANTLISHLEESRARAVAGLHGDDHGVHFDTTTYTQFRSDTYDAGAAENVTHTIADGLTLSTTEGDDEIVFSRITGATDGVVTITIEVAGEAEKSREILVGMGGDITLVTE